MNGIDSSLSLPEMTGARSKLVLHLCKPKRPISTTEQAGPKDEAGNFSGYYHSSTSCWTNGWGFSSIHPGAQFAHELLGHPSGYWISWNYCLDWFSAKSLFAVRALVTAFKRTYATQAKSFRTCCWAPEEELPLR